MRPASKIGVLAAVTIIMNAAAVSAQIVPTFVWSPSDPEIGENVVFTIGGVASGIDKATWDFGGPGCGGASAAQTCVPSPFDECKARAFKYSSSGNKLVSLSVEINGVTYADTRPAAERTVTVASSGSCNDGSEPYFTWLPGSPEIGEDVVFTIEGASSVTIDEAHWTMGGAGCEGVSSVQSCAGSIFNDCETLSYKYSTGGPKTVGLSIVVDGKTYTDDRPAGDRTLMVSYTGGCVVCSNQILEPGFEGGSGSAWSESSSNGYFLITMNRPHTGDYSAWLGGADNEQSSVWQSPAIDPMATSAKLTYWYEIDAGDYSADWGYCGAKVNGVFARGHEYDLSTGFATGGYVLSDFVDLLPYAGTTPEIRFEAFTSSQFGSFFVDDVTLEVCVFTSSNDQIFSDGFESGETSMWSITEPPLP